jgi:alkylation response protein AidB-like acyl-CoA dehydrogenase
MNGQDLRDRARRHVDTVVRDEVAGWERAGRFPRDAARSAGADGLCGLFAPVDVGGQGLGFADGMAVFEELGRGDASYAFVLSMQNAVAASIARHAADAVRGRWAGPLARGEALGGFSLTEPHAGSDASALTTLATAHGDGYRISGRKAWVSMAGEADLFLLACRTKPGRSPQDVMMVALPADRPGIGVERLYDKMASSFLPIGEVALEDVEISADEVVAPPGSGFQAALAAIDVARTDIAAIAVGLAAEALDVALRYTRAREAFGGTILDLQAIQFMLADVETDVVAGRLLYERAAGLLGTPEGSVAAAHAKRFCPDAALRAAVACSETLGAYGWLNDTPLPRFIALAKMLAIVDGTTEIQRVVIARHLRKRAEALS